MSEQWASPELLSLIVQRTNSWLDGAIKDATETLQILQDHRARTGDLVTMTIALDEVGNLEDASDEVKSASIAVSDAADHVRGLTYGWR